MDITDRHPLMQRQPRTIKNWAEWCQLWDEAACVEQCMGLVHCGFEVRASNDAAAERITTYLELADGHNAAYRYGFGGRHDEPEGTGELRAAIAEKAWKVLANKFFRDQSQGEGGFPPSWVRWIEKPSVLERVLWFFRLNELLPFKPVDLLNLQRGNFAHHGYAAELAGAFALELCKFGWWSSRISARTAARLSARRPQLIEILCGLGKADVLCDISRTKGLVWLDEACERTLETLALRPLQIDLRTSSERHITQTPTSVSWAAAHGSQPAEVLLLLRTMREQFTPPRPARV